MQSQRQVPVRIRGRGQPSKAQQVVEAARVVFLRDGFTNTTVDAIAAEANVSKQTIYNNFDGKEALFAAVADAFERSDKGEPEAAGVEALVGNSTDLARDLRELGNRWVSNVLHEEVATFRRLLLAEWDRHPELLASWKRPHPNLRRALARGISAQVARGALDIEDTELAASQLILLVITEALTRSLYGMRKLPAKEIEHIVGSGVDMWLRCYEN